MQLIGEAAAFHNLLNGGMSVPHLWNHSVSASLSIPDQYRGVDFLVNQELSLSCAHFSPQSHVSLFPMLDASIPIHENCIEIRAWDTTGM
jgi:hypothetical protein